MYFAGCRFFLQSMMAIQVKAFCFFFIFRRRNYTSNDQVTTLLECFRQFLNQLSASEARITSVVFNNDDGMDLLRQFCNMTINLLNYIVKCKPVVGVLRAVCALGATTVEMTQPEVLLQVKVLEQLYPYKYIDYLCFQLWN